MSYVPRPAAGNPTSAYLETPPPPVPTTTPTVFSGTSLPGSGNVWIDFTAPAGPFAAIIFNYTGIATGGVYDSSYRAYANGAQILEGTTPEYGTWTVRKDLNEYASLFVGAVNLSFYLGEALLKGGAFASNVSIAFYPVPVGGEAPSVPSEVIPLFEWNHTYLHAANGVDFANVTIPSNATNATLELYVYGFGTTDEFWYSAQPGYREAQLTVDGRTLAGLLPFPYINTGGVDLFLWRPLPGSFTLNDRPYEVDISGSLGLLEGRLHEIEGTLSGFTSGSTWLIGGSILVYTSPTAGAATSTAYRFTGGGPPTVSSGTTYNDASEAQSLQTSSVLEWNGASVNETTDLVESMSNDQVLHSEGTAGNSASWSNVTMDTRAQSTTWRNGSGPTFTTVRSLNFPLTFDTGAVQVETGSSGGTTFYNVTEDVNAYHQEWKEVDASGVGLSPLANGSIVDLDDLTTAAGYFVGQYAVSSSGTQLTGFSAIVSSTSKTYTYDQLGGAVPATYEHILDGSSFDPAGPNNVETVLANEVYNPLGVAIRGGDGPSIDVGQSLDWYALVTGGSQPYTYDWSGLPKGCLAADNPVLVCRPSSAGTVTPKLVVTDSGGNSSSATGPTTTIFSTLAVAIVPARTTWDSGQNASFTAAVTGGDPTAESCRWWNDTSTTPQALTPVEPCELPENLTVSASDPPTLLVTVQDATGGNATSVPVIPAVDPDPSVTVSAGTPANQAVVGGSLLFNASVSGGSAPFRFQWALNGTNLTGASGVYLIWEPLAPGDYDFSVWVTDAANESVSSGASPVHVLHAPVVTTNPQGGTTTTSVDYTGWYVAVGVAAAAAVLILLLIARPPRRP